MSRILHLISLNHRPTFLVSPTTKDPVKRKGRIKNSTVAEVATVAGTVEINRADYFK
jgi:hypothetical protein